MTKITFIGLGNMGAGMAVNLIKAGHEITVFDLNQAAIDHMVECGAVGSSSVGEAVSGAEVAITMLPAGQHVKSVYLGDDGIIAASSENTLLVDCSTIDVETAREVSSAAAAVHLHMVDAPVSGGIAAAAAGTLTFMVGGSEAAYLTAKPYLGSMGSNVIHAGDSGTGQAAKICNNMMLGIQMISTAEGFLLAEKLGLDAGKLFEISSKASAQCWSLTSYCPVPGPVATSPANNNYKAGFAAAMMLKDLKLAQEAASKAGADTPLGKHAKELYDKYSELGNGAVDFSGIINMLRK